MNDDLLLERRLRATLEDVPRVSDHVLTTALARVAVTTQRRSLRDRWLPTRPVRAVAATLAAVAVIAGSAVIGSSVLLRQAQEATVGPIPDTGTWSGQIYLSPGASLGTATRLSDGRVLILGMAAGAMRGLLWDPTTGRAASAGTVDGDTRESHSATLLPDGRVLIAGGLHGSYADPATDTALIWDPTSGTFTPTGPLVRRRASHLAVGLDDGRVLLLGGEPKGTAEIYEPEHGGFVPFEPRSALAGYGVATRLADGRVLVLGNPEDGRCTEIWDASGEDPSVTGPMQGGCQARSATLLHDGRVLVVSSPAVMGEAPDSDEPWAEAALFDPASGTYVPAGTLIGTVDRSAAVGLADGRVLLAGGYGSDGRSTAAVNVWDPAAGTFTPAAPMNTPRSEPDLVLLDDGRVLAEGGWDVERRPDSESGSGIPSLEVFDPR